LEKGIIKTCKVIAILSSLILLSVLSLRDILFSPGILVGGVDVFFAPYPHQYLTFLSETFFVWTTRISLLGYDTSYSNYLQLWSFYGLSASLGVNGEILSKGIIIFLLVLSGCSAYHFSKSFGKSDIASFAVAIFYMFTPLVFDMSFLGFTPHLIAYALFPSIIVFFFKSFEEKNHIRSSVITGILYSIATIDEHAIILLAIVFLLYSAYLLLVHGTKLVRSCTESLFIVFGICFLINSYWVLNVLQSSTIATSATSEIYLSWNPVMLLDAIRLQAFNIFPIRPFGSALANQGVIGLSLSFVPVFFAYMAPFLKRSKYTIFFSVLAILSTFLAVGVNMPFFGDIYLQLYKNFLVLRIFRYTFEFLLLTALSYVFLIAETIDQILMRASSLIARLKIAAHSTRTCMPFFHLRLTQGAFILIMLLVALPFVSGDFGRAFQTVTLPNEYTTTENWLLEQKGDFKVLWLPTDRALFYPEGQRARDLSIFSPHSGTIGTDSADPYSNKGSTFAKFLIYTLYENRTEYLGKLFGICGIKYIILREDLENAMDWRYNSNSQNFSLRSGIQLLDILTHQKGLKEIKHEGSIRIFLNEYFIPRVSIADDPTLVVGDLRSLISLSYLDRFDFQDHSLVFVNQLDSRSSLWETSRSIIINSNSLLDLCFSLLPTQYTVSFSSSINGYYGSDNWASLMSWYYFNDWDYTATTDDPIIAGAWSGRDASISVPVMVQNNGVYDIWMKVFQGNTESGSISVFVDNHELYTINLGLNRTGRGFYWTHLTSTTLALGNHDLKLLSNGGENVIAGLIVAPKKEIDNAFVETYEFLSSRNVTYLFEAEDFKEMIEDTSWSISECDTSQDWFGASGSWNISVDTSDYMNGTASIRGITTMSNSWNYMQYNTPEPMDLSDKDYIGFYFKTDSLINNPTFSMIARADVGWTNYYQYFFTSKIARANTWYHLEIPKNQFIKYGIADWSRIDNIAFGLYSSSNATFTIHIDNVVGFNDPWSISECGSSASGGRAISEGNSSGEIIYSFYVPRTENYSVALRVRANTSTDLPLRIDGERINLSLERTSDWYWVNSTDFKLNSGYHELAIKNKGLSNTKVSIDLISIESSLQEMYEYEQHAMFYNYSLMDPTTYIVHTNTSRPCFIVFSDSYHPSWAVEADGEKFSPIVVNGFSNGFYVNKTVMDMKVRFEKQNIREIGLSISAITLIGTLLYLVYPLVARAPLRRHKKPTYRSHALESYLMVSSGKTILLNSIFDLTRALGLSRLRAMGKINGSKVLYRPFIGGELSMVWGDYEPSIRKYFVPNKGDIVVDVGANIGYYTLWAAKKVGTIGKVISIEPEPSNYKLLLQNLSLNRLQNVVPVNIALSDKIDVTRLYMGKRSVTHSICQNVRDARTGHSIAIPTTTLDSLLKKLRVERVDWLKIDVEGAELEVIRGAAGALALEEIKIIAEISGSSLCSRVNPVHQLLRTGGFEIKVLYESPSHSIHVIYASRHR
jgi:FkbM family methyltransferase